MCFSAHISFITAASLSIISLVSMHITTRQSQRMIALTPLMFGIQQLAEAGVWLAIPGQWGQIITSYIFLIFAMLIWPIWLPFSLVYAEQQKQHKKILALFVILGIVWTLFVLLCIPQISINTYLSNHIAYIIQYMPFSGSLLTVMYLIPTVIPFFITTVPLAQLIGILMLSSCFITYYLYTYFFVSLWCFFAALVSILSLLSIYVDNQHK